MQSYHFNAETDHSKHGFPDAALSIFFSVENYNAKTTPEEIAIIDNFFDTLQFKTDTSASQSWSSTSIPYANLINLMDWNNRWVYKGSVTTPPCETMVYWNVLATVYPVKQKHLDNFK
jgi:carbonic anhydrase